MSYEAGEGLRKYCAGLASLQWTPIFLRGKPGGVLIIESIQQVSRSAHLRLFDPDSDTVSVVAQVAPTPGKPPTPGPPSRAGELPPGPPLEVPHNLQRIRTAVTPPLQQQDQTAHMHGESWSCLVVPSPFMLSPFMLSPFMLSPACCKAQAEANVAACGSDAMQLLRSTCCM